MYRKLTTAAAAALIVGAGAVPALARDTSKSPGPTPTFETLFLDTYEAPSDGFAGPVKTQQPLAPGKLYFATIDGTFRYSRPATLNSPSYIWCPGSVENVPITYPSTDPAATNDTAYADADTVFALRVFRSNAGSCPQLPYHNTALQFDVGGGPEHLEPAGGPFTAPPSSHEYNYVLRGQGSIAQFSFQLRDRPTTDNAGQLRIRMVAATQADCKKNGWREFVVDGELIFKNQGDCVSYIATSTRNQPAGPGAS